MFKGFKHECRDRFDELFKRNLSAVVASDTSSPRASTSVNVDTIGIEKKWKKQLKETNDRIDQLEKEMQDLTG